MVKTGGSVGLGALSGTTAPNSRSPQLPAGAASVPSPDRTLRRGKPSICRFLPSEPALVRAGWLYRTRHAPLRFPCQHAPVDTRDALPLLPHPVEPPPAAALPSQWRLVLSPHPPHAARGPPPHQPVRHEHSALD